MIWTESRERGSILVVDVTAPGDPGADGSEPADLTGPRFDEARRRVVSSSLRVTRQRVAVLAVIQPGEHLDADTIAARARQVLGSISRQAVYDALAALARAQLIRTIEPAGSPVLHEIRVGDNHHHLVCRECGRVVDVDCAAGAAPCLEPPDRHGFQIDAAEVTWWGLCEDCAPSDTPPNQFPRKDSP